MMSYEEFHTSQRRHRATKISPNGEVKSEMPQQSVTKNKEMRENSGDSQRVISPKGNGPLMRNSLGNLVESREVQMVLIVLIYSDLIASTFRLLIIQDQQRHISSTDNELGEDESFSILLRALESFTGFTLFFFMLEIGALMFSFGPRFFTHLGYGTDALIITLCLASELFRLGNIMVRLLGFFRIWRVARLVSTILWLAQAEHTKTKSCLRDEQRRGERLCSRVNFLEESSKNEISHRKQVEKTLQGYKDEVETLAEALKIAAFDVAGAAHEIAPEQKIRDNLFVDKDGDEFFDN